MNYILMRKEIPVVEMSLDEAAGAVQKVGNAHHSERLMGLAQERRNQTDDQTQDVKKDTSAGYSVKMDGIHGKQPGGARQTAMLRRV